MRHVLVIRSTHAPTTRPIKCRALWSSVSRAISSDQRAMTLEPSSKQLEDAVYFWNADQPNGEFSQWYPSPFVVAGQSYPTAEHYMMASKARLFRDHDSERLIIGAQEPEQVRDLGRKIKNFDGALWNDKKFEIVKDGNRAKFKDPILRAVMLGTGDRLFVEASPVDRIWGVGFDRDEAPSKVTEWGENLMGKVMMQIRDEIRNRH